MYQNKVSLSPFDSKRWIADDGIRTKAYGYKNVDIFPTFTDDEIREMEAEASKLPWG